MCVVKQFLCYLLIVSDAWLSLCCVMLDVVCVLCLAGSDSPLPGLANISLELQLLILKHLAASDLVSLAATSKHFNTVAKDNQLWRRLYLKCFGSALYL